ncbi:pH-response regulator protein palH/rim21 [Friedmanniomyces endolithicus]|nr:pH-response regulator protein palH/rim21 [Friedmanniomyces endolithicus]
MSHDAAALSARQLWFLHSSSTSPTLASHCTPFTLPSHGVLSLANTVITLTKDVVFQPECTGSSNQGVSAIDKVRDPFYASTTPQTYVIAATTVIAWVLVVMLVITPRTSLLGQLGGAPSFGNGRGMIGGATGGGGSLIGVGSRPWLQKVAALTVAISMTIVTADTFKVATVQYADGYMDASILREEVLGSLEVRITRVISDVFLWLAQVQTLIRLFPRHKEKVLIKWIGFGLILFDSTFSCLNSFGVNNRSRPGHFVDAIPALSYLFELALGLLYAAWVLYYSVTKRRYAFYHSKMRSICVIALLSLIAVLTPVVFFVTDVSNENVAGWGDYFRWVGAAAASVVVWEWVERIEALERDEKKDGILGREIFDGDEMLDVTPNEEAVWNQSRRRRSRLRRGDDSDGGRGGAYAGVLEHGFSSMAQHFRRGHRIAQEHYPLGRAHSSTTTGQTPDPTSASNANGRVTFGHLPKPGSERTSRIPDIDQLTPPLPVASPISRVDTASAASTVYVVRYDTAADVPQPVRRRAPRDVGGNTAEALGIANAQQQRGHAREAEMDNAPDADAHPNRNRGQTRWQAVSNPFKRKRALPPVEVQQARRAAADASSLSRASTPAHNVSRWNLTGQLGVLAAETGERLRDRGASARQDVDVPVTVIPAQPRGSGRTWSPELHHQQQRATAQPSSSAAPESSHTAPATADNMAALGSDDAHASSTVVSTPHRRSHPPRAHDTSPVGDGSSARPTIIPAPRRSPLRISMPARSSSGDALGPGDFGRGAARDGGNGDGVGGLCLTRWDDRERSGFAEPD